MGRTFWQIVVKNCYQWFTAALRGGNYNVLGGTFVFGSTNPSDFSSVAIYEVVAGDPVYSTTIGCGTTIELFVGTEYIIAPALTPGSFYLGDAVHLHVVAPSIEAVDYNHDGCFAFGEPFHFSLSPNLAGLCNPPQFSYTTPSGTTHSVGSGEYVVMEDDGYCTPPPGQAWIGGPRCTTITVSATLNPCDWDDPNCPPLVISYPLVICCNNCQPYGTPPDARLIPGSETDLSVYPNPASDKLEIKAVYAGMMEIYNTVGQLVKTIIIDANSKVSVDATPIPPGNYIYKYGTAGKETIIGKLIIIH